MLSPREKINLQSLYSVLINVDDFPKNGRELKSLAKLAGADRSVMNFFEEIPQTRVFENRNDVFGIAEVIDELVDRR